MERQRQRHSKQQELGKQPLERRHPPVEPPSSGMDLSAPDRGLSVVAKALATGRLPSGASVKPVSPVHARDNLSTRSGSGSPRRATASPRRGRIPRMVHWAGRRVVLWVPLLVMLRLVRSHL